MFVMALELLGKYVHILLIIQVIGILTMIAFFKGANCE